MKGKGSQKINSLRVLNEQEYKEAILSCKVSLMLGRYIVIIHFK